MHQGLGSVFDVARHINELPKGRDSVALNGLYRFSHGQATCRVSPALVSKYGLVVSKSDSAQPRNNQLVVGVTNVYTLEQAWFNEARGSKPQSFVAEPPVDPTGGGGDRCDFCRWGELTAEDEWGRVENEHAVTASNLFKYAEPAHGVVLFKHHDPLTFSLAQLRGLLSATDGWINKAALQHPYAHHPFVLWNCLHRAGASQFHGHAQVMLSQVALPAQERLNRAAQLYHDNGREHAFRELDYFDEVLRAHRCCGLLRSCTGENEAGGQEQEEDVAWACASLAPVKDMEMVVQGSHITSPAFTRLLHACLRTLVDHLGCMTFNLGILNIDEPRRSWPPYKRPPVVARLVSRGKLSSAASDFGGLEVVGGASIGHTDPFRVIQALDAQLALAGVTCRSFPRDGPM